MIADSSGNGRDAALVRGESAALVSDPAGGSALQLPGGPGDSTTAAYVELPSDVLDPDADSATISTQVRWDGNAAWPWVYALGYDVGNWLTTTPNDGSRLQTRMAVDDVHTEFAAERQLPSGWHNLTVVLDGDAKTVTT